MTTLRLCGYLVLCVLACATLAHTAPDPAPKIIIHQIPQLSEDPYPMELIRSQSEAKVGKDYHFDAAYVFKINKSDIPPAS